MTEIITIASNAVVAKLHNPSRELKLEVQGILSYAVAGAEHTMTFKKGSWDGRSSFLDFRAGTFPAGFVLFLAAALRRKGYTVNTVRKPLPLPLGPEKPVVDTFGDDPRYDFQMDVVNRLVKHGQIIAQVATGGGKSRCCKLAFARIGRPAMFLTTRGILMYQMHEAFERDLGVKASILGDGQFGHTIIEGGIERQAVKKISVAMVQTLIARLEEKTVQQEVDRMIEARLAKELKVEKALKDKLVRAGQPWAKVSAAVKTLEKTHERERMTNKQMLAIATPKIEEHMIQRAKTIKVLELMELVILEEAHEASGNSYYEILRHCKNAHYRLALTATPFMKDSEESNMRLMACSGPVGIRVSEKQLIDSGILAKPHFTILPLHMKPEKLYRQTSWQAAYRIGIVENDYRNNLGVARCKMFADRGMSSMVLIQQTAHGDILVEKMTAAGLRVEFIRGEDDQVGRKSALTRLAAGEIDVLIGTTILDVGVDVPAVGHVCLMGGGKAEVALRQRIGRGLRAKKTGPNLCFITDFADDYNTHLKTHSLQRLAIIKGTEGFADNIMEGGRDFDFQALGFGIAEKLAA
jgi:superfamily II DNA or RNA helicase